MADMYATPARRPRPRSSASGGRRSSSLLGTESELTPGGAQILHAGLKRSGRALALQVLGVYRYAADPELKQVLTARAADALEWDVFDIVVSDGQMKMKALLSPALNDLVWRGVVRELEIVEIDDYEVISVQDDSDDAAAQTRRNVCVIYELTARDPPSNHDVATDSQSTTTPRAKIVYSVGSALLASPLPSAGGSSSGAVPDVQFISDAHIRDHGALPLAGSRLYYLSLLSDDYPAEWEPVQRESLSPVSLATPWAEWNRRRRYCTDIFTSTDRTLHTIREANLMTSQHKRSAEMEEGTDTRPPPPPMIGFVRFKSGLFHVATTKVANDFPFMFHIVLSDSERSVEIAFFGSMAAKNFLVVQEGDLIQLQGYTVSRSVPHETTRKTRKLFYFPHLSTGVVSHVPDKYWQLLETMKVLDKRPRMQSEREDNDQPTPRRGMVKAKSEPTVWLRPTFLTTFDVVEESAVANDDQVGDTYFDFVGVVTFVGRMHRQQPTREDLNPNAIESLKVYRWIKCIDSTSKKELVVRLYVNSQPTAFHAIQSGDVALLSKLQFVHARKEDIGLEFATSSVYTTIRLNDDLDAFQVFPECVDTFALVKSLRANGGFKTQYSNVDSPLVATTESWLEGPSVHDYEPTHEVARMSESIVEAVGMLATADGEDPSRHWIPSFNPAMSIPTTQYTIGIGYNYPFQDVAAIAASMDALSHRYIRVHVALHDIRVAAATTPNAVPDIELVVTDGEQQDQPPQSIRIRSNILFREHVLPSPLDELVATEAEPLARLLSPEALKSLNTASILRSTELPQFSPAKASLGSSPVDSEPQITLDIVKEYIMKNREGSDEHHVGGIDVALHLYRMSNGELDLWIDSINL